MAYIDIRIEFDEEPEDGYTHYTPVRAKFLGSDVDEEGIAGIWKASGQSDRYTVGVTNAVLNALGGETTKVEY